MLFQDNEGYGSPIYGYNSMRNEWNDVILPAVPSEQFTHRMSYNIRGLDTASEYEAKVMAKNRFGWTPMSDVFKFVTSATPEVGKNIRHFLIIIQTYLYFIKKKKKIKRNRKNISIVHHIEFNYGELFNRMYKYVKNTSWFKL